MAPFSITTTAVTYNPEVVPIGATASLTMAPETAGATVIRAACLTLSA